MPLPVSLKDAAEAIGACPPEWRVYLGRKTGELITVPNEESEPAEDDDWKADSERIENAPEDFIMLPEQRDMDEYRMMERFCYTVTDERKQERLLDAISGKGAFRRFKDMIFKVGVRDEWFTFRDRAYAEELRGFLEVNGIAHKDDVGRG